MRKTFYITTPIYYVNDVPHIGHTCTTIAADIVARYHRLINDDVFFLTGTDEHGAKVAEAAGEEKLSPKKFCDKVSKRFENSWRTLNIGNDFFIRTTDERHEKIAQELTQKIYDAGDIYKGKYEGLYCLGCEKFLTETDLVDGKCPLHPNKEPQTESEENYFFRLSKYAPRLIGLIEDDKTNYIFPEGKRKEILTKLKSGVNDISISREKVKWGIPTPWDKNHTIYVWFEALINYYSATQFLEGKRKFWLADIHLIGKEILWFHTVIWQAMLLSAKIDLPKKVFAHSFYTIDGQKMSKSLGNVISPDDLIKNFGVDGSRWLIADSFPAEDDTDVGIEKFKEKYNADLANGLGNLISRVASICWKNGFQFNPKKETYLSEFQKDQKIKTVIDKCNLIGATEIVRNKVNSINQLINKLKLWELKGEKLKKELKNIVESIYKISYFISPFMPETAEKIKNQFNGKIQTASPLFPRLK